MGKFLLKRKEVVVVRKGEAVSYLEEEVQDQPTLKIKNIWPTLKKKNICPT